MHQRLVRIVEMIVKMDQRNGLKGNRLSVGIVGAGLAGLRCADVLLRYGCQVTIFEARDRLGGRVAQSNHLGHAVDLGANWIHGTVNNPIYEIAKRTRTTLHAWDEGEAMIDPEGQLLDPAEADEYTRLLWDDGLIAEAFKYSKEHGACIDSSQSLYDFLKDKAKDLFQAEEPETAERRREMFLHTTHSWGGYIGNPITRQTLKFFWIEECMSGENPFVAGTYADILREIAKPAQEQAEILYECEATGIESSLSSDGGACKATVEYGDGSKATFDAVVVTTPLGWLKHNQAAFKPPLPPKLSQAINNIDYGALDKVYITFPSAFWDEPPFEETSLPNGSDPQNKTPNFRAAGMPLHQPPSTQRADHYPSISMFLSPTYAPDTNPQQWYQECFNLSALPDGHAHPTLLFYTQGDCSRHIAGLISTAAEDKPAADAKVIAFMQPYYSLLPNYDPTNPACIPSAVLATAWAGDKWAGYGAYSNLLTGLEHADEDIETMRYGMPERAVYLAGEHTAPFLALGTTQGAYISGEKVAERILAAHGIDRRT